MYENQTNTAVSRILGYSDNIRENWKNILRKINAPQPRVSES